MFVMIGALLLSGVAALQAPPAAAQGFGNTDVGGLTSGFGGNISTCAIETVGWVICPVMRSIAKVADYGFAFINTNFLQIDYSMTSTDSGIYTGWEIMRNIANIAFVMAFIYIIYAQISGHNAGSYNIKRLLPKLVIGAVLVNISYYLCAAAVQVSNVLGSATLDIMKGVAERIGTPAMTLDSAANGFEDGILIDMTSAVLTKTGTVWILLAPVAAIIISIAVVSGAGLILLIARKVIVSMLVLVSPILFVAYLLPNLERFFQQWMRLFIQLLMLYPVIAFLLGVGQIVSATIISVGTGDSSGYSVQDDSYQSKSGGSGHIGTDLAAAGAAVLPLVGVWFMMKGLSSIMSTAGTKISANVGSGRRSGKEEAKVTSKIGKVEPKPNTMLGKTFNRRPAFSRLAAKRRKATPGGSALRMIAEPRPNGTPGASTAPTPPTPPQNPLVDALKNQLDNPEIQAKDVTANQAAEQQAAALAGQQAAEISAGQATLGKGGELGKQLSAALKEGAKEQNGKATASGGRTKEPGTQRSFGGGSSAAPSAPAHAGLGGSAPAAPAPPVVPQIITVMPQQAMTGGADANGVTGSVSGLQAPPEAGVAKKARARAQKYIFDSTTAIEEAQEKIDLLAKQRTDPAAAEQQISPTPPAAQPDMTPPKES